MSPRKSRRPKSSNNSSVEQRRAKSKEIIRALRRLGKILGRVEANREKWKQKIAKKKRSAIISPGKKTTKRSKRTHPARQRSPAISRGVSSAPGRYRGTTLPDILRPSILARQRRRAIVVPPTRLPPFERVRHLFYPKRYPTRADLPPAPVQPLVFEPVQPLAHTAPLHLPKNKRGAIAAKWNRKLSDAESAQIDGLIKANMNLAHTVAQRMMKVIPFNMKGFTDYEDVLQVALDAMKRSALTYDPKIGTKFSTWVYPGMRNAILHFFQPYKSKGRAGTAVSLSEPRGGRKSRSRELADDIEDTRPPVHIPVVVQEKVKKAIADSGLSLRSQEILLLRFGIGKEKGMTLVAIAKKIGVSPERIRQVEASALEVLSRNPSFIQWWNDLRD